MVVLCYICCMALRTPLAIGSVSRGDRAMVTQLRPPRAETPQRWQAALRRAANNALDVFKVVGMDGTFAVTSASDPSLCYLATPTSCGCPAALADDAVCMHRAAVRAALGLLP